MFKSTFLGMVRTSARSKFTWVRYNSLLPCYGAHFMWVGSFQATWWSFVRLTAATNVSTFPVEGGTRRVMERGTVARSSPPPHSQHSTQVNKVSSIRRLMATATSVSLTTNSSSTLSKFTKTSFILLLLFQAMWTWWRRRTATAKFGFILSVKSQSRPVSSK